MILLLLWGGRAAALQATSHPSQRRSLTRSSLTEDPAPFSLLLKLIPETSFCVFVHYVDLSAHLRSYGKVALMIKASSGPKEALFSFNRLKKIPRS